MSDARVKVSLIEGTIEIEGSESFVSDQLEKFGDSIRGGLASVRGRSHQIPRVPGGTDGPSSGSSAKTGAADLDDVFAATENSVQILVDIPGDSNSEKMANAGKLLAYGMSKLKNKETVLFEEVKAVCRAHGCYDENNMAAVLKKQKSAFVFGGSGKKQSISLTKPGMTEVDKMIETMRGVPS